MKDWTDYDLPTDTKSWVYYIGCKRTRMIKIGTSTNLTKRFRDLQAMSPTMLEVLAVEPGGRYLEHERHQHWNGAHERGEWFRGTKQLRAFIRVIRNDDLLKEAMGV
jgi:hypothetical protein